MKRKLIKQGAGGLTFYVPKDWVNERGLQAGELIDVEKYDDKLLLSTEKSKTKKEIEITIKNESKEFIRNYLNQIYRLGYDKIRINCSVPKQLLLCQKFIQMFLLGFEVTNLGNKHCVAESISEPGRETHAVILRRMFLLIKESYQILLEETVVGKLTRRKDINRLVKKVTQYDNFCKRRLAKQNLAFGIQFFNWEMYNYLLIISHSFFHLYEEVDKIAKKKDFLNCLRKIQQNYSGIYEAFFKKDLSKLDRLQKEANKLFYDLKDSQYNLRELIRLQYLLCSPMLSVVQSNS